MQEKKRPTLPQARKDDLVIRELPDEILVYDLKRDKAHCLNPLAAAIWRRCDGETSIAKIARIVRAESKMPVTEEAVWLGLDQLEKSYLLQAVVTRPGERKLSRRELVRRLGLTAGIALPVITSILAPTVVEAASCAHLGQSCKFVACCPGCVCAAGLCAGVC